MTKPPLSVRAAPGASANFSFGPFTLSGGDRTLRKGDVVLPIGSRGFDLLKLLLERAGAIVSKNEIIETVWDDVVATEESVRVQLSSLRKLLEDQARPPKYILNVPGRGYTCVALVTRVVGNYVRRVGDPRSAPLVGRADVLRSITSGLAMGSVTTIVGPGGVGKTAVARGVADAVGREWRDGVVWVDLADLLEDEFVASAVANALGIASPIQDPVAGIVTFLLNRNLLLVLDCCERVALGAAVLAERIAESMSESVVLATSREALRIRSERVVRLPPLVSPLTHNVTANEAAAFPAIQLFVARASNASVAFALTDENAPVIAELCGHLDGLPLAIELAAAHLVALSPAQLRDFLGTGFIMSRLGRRTGEARHETLQATLDWSYERLLEPERHALQRLAVFEGASTLHSILDVLAAPGLRQEQILTSVLLLAEKSLLKVESDGHGTLHRLLDTTRAFASNRLLASGGFDEASRRHANYLLRCASGSEIEGAAQSAASWLGPACPNLANLRAALRWCFATNDRELALKLTCAALPLLMQLSLLEECERWAARALTLISPAESDTETYVQLLAFRGGAMLAVRGPVDSARDAMNNALEAAERLGFRQYSVLALSGLYWLRMYRGEAQLAMDCAQRIRVPASADDAPENLVGLNYVAMATCLLGDQKLARERLANDQARWAKASLGRFMRVGSDPGILSRTFLIKTLWLSGRIEAAEALYTQCIGVLREPEHGLYLCLALNEIVIPFYAFQGKWAASADTLTQLREGAIRQAMSIRVESAECTAAALELLQGRGNLAAFAKALESLRDAHFLALVPWLEGVLVQSLMRVGDIPGAIAAADRAILACQKAGCNWWLSELLRLRGLAKSDAAESLPNGLADLSGARNLARDQSAVALELRAALSEARCLQTLNRAAEFVPILEEILGRYPEREADDLRQALRWLGELNLSEL